MEKGLSEIIFTTGSPVLLRKNLKLSSIGNDLITKEFQLKLLTKLLTEEENKRLLNKDDLDLAVSFSGIGRFRLNVFNQYKGITMIFRPIMKKVPELEEYGFDAKIIERIKRGKGLILVNGASGSGKTTLLSSIVEFHAKNFASIAITLEKPVEYSLENSKGIILQREIGRDSPDFTNALDVIHHQNPDIIAVDDIVDENVWPQLINLGITGHLVIATVGTVDSLQSIEYILHQFPDFQRGQILKLLASSLVMSISQKNIPGNNEDTVFSREVLINTENISKLISDDKLYMVSAAMESGKAEGQLSFDESLKKLISLGKIKASSTDGNVSADVARADSDLVDLEKALYNADIEVRKKAESKLKVLESEGNKGAKKILEDFSRFYITNFEEEKRGPI